MRIVHCVSIALAIYLCALEAAPSSSQTITIRTIQRTDSTDRPIRSAPMSLKTGHPSEIECHNKSNEDGTLLCRIRSCGGPSDIERRHELFFGEIDARIPSKPDFVVTVEYRDGNCAVTSPTLPIVVAYAPRSAIASALISDLFINHNEISSIRLSTQRDQIVAPVVPKIVAIMREPLGMSKFIAARAELQQRAAIAAARDPSSDEAVLLKAQLDTFAAAGMLNLFSPNYLDVNLIESARTGGIPALAKQLETLPPSSSNDFSQILLWESKRTTIKELSRAASDGKFGTRQFRVLEGANTGLFDAANLPQRSGGLN